MVREDVLQLGFCFGHLLFELRNFFVDAAHFGDLRGGVLLVLLEARDFLRGLVLQGAQPFHAGDELAAAGVQGGKVAQHLFRVHSAVAQLAFDERQIAAHEVQVEHRGDSLSAGFFGLPVCRSIGLPVVSRQ